MNAANVSKQAHPGEQAQLWNGSAGQAWVAGQELLDGLFKPFEKLLVDTVGVSAGNRILDVGCGAGSTTLAVARVLGTQGGSIGIDISAPMIEAARVRAQRENLPVDFICGDAQLQEFTRGTFDVILSRFGVMFFSDPVAAFANLLRATRDGGKLCFAAWRSAAENPFMTTAERAAAPLFPGVPLRRPSAAGQFAFADPHLVRNILSESGWKDISIEPIDVQCSIPEHGLIPYFMSLGPLGTALQNASADLRAKVIETVGPAFEPFVSGNEVRLTAACWMVRASANPRGE